MKSLLAVLGLLILSGCASSTPPTTPIQTALPIFDASGEFKQAAGIEYKVVKAGTGSRAQSARRVTVWYDTLHVNNLEPFDSTRHVSAPVEFELKATVKGFENGIRLMREGDIFFIKVPAALAYGHKGCPPMIAPDEDLYFTIELVKVVD